MEIVVENVTSAKDLQELASLRRRVFEKEWHKTISDPALQDAGRAWHLLARCKEIGISVGTLSIVDTTGQDELHSQYALQVPKYARVARLTQLAVLKPFRGCGIPRQLIQSALDRIVAPSGFDLVWLLFDAGRANSSCMVRDLNFSSSPYILNTDYGACRVLSRQETPWRNAARAASGAMSEPVLASYLSQPNSY